MRIAMVTPYSWAHPGGVNNHVRGLAGEMIRRGNDVVVVAPDSGACPEGAGLESAGRSVPVPANGSIAHLAVMPGSGRRVARAVSGGFDVVHVHEPLVPAVGPAAVRAAAGRVVATFHAAADGRSLVYNLSRTFYSGIIGRLDARIAVSESARSLIYRYFPGDYEIVPNGVDLCSFSPDRERPGTFPPEGAPVVLFVGRNEKRKGLDVLLRAFPTVAGLVPSCTLALVGEGLDERSAAGMPASLRKRIVVLGRIEGERLPDYYAAADVFCAPALGGESFGVVLLEAMACGTPVVASDIPGYRDVLERAGGGVLFRRGDETDLAERLVELLTDEEGRRRLGERGREGVGAFSWRLLGDRIENIYGVTS